MSANKGLWSSLVFGLTSGLLGSFGTVAVSLCVLRSRRKSFGNPARRIFGGLLKACDRQLVPCRWTF
ncbi:hypothetical protein [Paenibacillus sp. CAA11]|uniref:hypothetical protein n=1 Tax=Paenibacillus sp. CAA11 TaxID=1532905 RepID=UPI00131F18DC|nr:hypothetical protein [Paenibacillus sp. CAA11]